MWPRSHSLGDLNGEPGTSSAKKLDASPQGVPNAATKSITSGGGGQVTEHLVTKQNKEVLKGKAKEWHFSAAIPSSGTLPLFLRPNCDIQSSSLSRCVTRTSSENFKKSIHELGRTDHSLVPKDAIEADIKVTGEVRTQPKISSQPPPVPAKKSRERLSNGHCHSPSALSSSDAPSLPAKKTSSFGLSDSRGLTVCRSLEQEPSSPLNVRPPWLLDLPETASVQQHVLKLDPSSVRKVSSNRSLDLEMLIENKLQAENIDLTEDPYSDKVQGGAKLSLH